jgi:hypothetical protein
LRAKPESFLLADAASDPGYHLLKTIPLAGILTPLSDNAEPKARMLPFSSSFLAHA